MGIYIKSVQDIFERISVFAVNEFNEARQKSEQIGTITIFNFYNGTGVQARVHEYGTPAQIFQSDNTYDVLYQEKIFDMYISKPDDCGFIECLESGGYEVKQII